MNSTCGMPNPCDLPPLRRTADLAPALSDLAVLSDLSEPVTTVSDLPAFESPQALDTPTLRPAKSKATIHVYAARPRCMKFLKIPKTLAEQNSLIWVAAVTRPDGASFPAFGSTCIVLPKIRLSISLTPLYRVNCAPQAPDRDQARNHAAHCSFSFFASLGCIYCRKLWPRPVGPANSIGDTMYENNAAL